ncbi:metal-sensing transcriptional repressor, partial [Escherichia coli]
MPSTPEEKKKVLTRVRRIRGQIDALERSLEYGTAFGITLQRPFQSIN